MSNNSFIHYFRMVKPYRMDPSSSPLMDSFLLYFEKVACYLCVLLLICTRNVFFLSIQYFVKISLIVCLVMFLQLLEELLTNSKLLAWRFVTRVLFLQPACTDILAEQCIYFLAKIVYIRMYEHPSQLGFINSQFGFVSP